MLKIKSIIIEDEPLAAMLIESYVTKTPYLEHVATFSSAIEAMKSDKLAEADLIFLDIQMPTLNGLEFSKMIDERTKIIFTTAFNQYALDGYKVNALDYLMKPISYDDFLKAAGRAQSWFQLNERANQPAKSIDKADAIYVKSNYKLLRIELSKLIYIEGLKDYVKFIIEDSDQPVLSLMNIKHAEDLLPSEDFIRVHRSYIVRKDKIAVIERNRIVFDKVIIPIGDAYKNEVSEFLKGKTL